MVVGYVWCPMGQDDCMHMQLALLYCIYVYVCTGMAPSWNINFSGTSLAHDLASLNVLTQNRLLVRC